MKATKLSFFLLGAVVLTGCSTQTMIPAENHITEGVVCITPDDSNRKVAYNCTIGALQQKGYTVKEIGHRTNDPNCDAILDCQTVSRWDVANFTSDIKYEWYEDGTKIGRCHYQAKSGLNFTKFINTQGKVNDLLNKLLPKSKKLPSRYEGQAANW